MGLIETIYPDGSNVDKSLIIGDDKSGHRRNISSVSEVQSNDWSGQTAGIYVRELQANFDLVTGDLSPDDGVTCLVDTMGNRFKIVTVAGSVSDEILAAFSSKADVEAAGIPIGPNYLMIAGYYAAGDGGCSLYKRVVSEPTHEGKIQSLDGAWWELAEHELNAKMFGAVGDGVADDTADIQAALDFGKPVKFPTGNYLISSTVNLTLSGSAIVGVGKEVTTFTSSATGESIKVASGLSGIELRDFALTRASGGSTPGRNGIHFTGVTERALICNVDVEEHYIGFRLGTTSYSEVKSIFANNNFSHGTHVTNVDGVGTGMQWYFDGALLQQNDGDGMRVEASASSASVGTLKEVRTYANKLKGLRVIGNATGPRRINGIRIDGGFHGENGDGNIHLDTYSLSPAYIVDAYVEGAGLTACGRNGGTAATNVGWGIRVTDTNYAPVSIVGCTVITNSYAGLSTDAPRILISGNVFERNGQAAVGGELTGININAGSATVVGNDSMTQTYGIFLANDNHVIVGNNFSDNTAPLGSTPTISASLVFGNNPLTTIQNFPIKSRMAVDADLTIVANDELICTSAALTAARTWTLPAANAVQPGKTFKLRDVLGTVTSTNTITVTRAGSDTIDGATSIVLRNAYGGLDVVSDGVSKWTVEVAGVAQGGTGLASGTSGGIPYFIATNRMASSAALASGQVVVGGGAGAAPATIANGQLPATATNDSASAGKVGEYIESVISLASAVSLVNSTSANLTSISLTAGDWDVSVQFGFTGGTTTNVFNVEGSVSLASATHDFTVGRGAGVLPFNTSTFNNLATDHPLGVHIGPVRMSLSTTTTIYAVASSVFSTSTCKVFGIIRARRIR